MSMRQSVAVRALSEISGDFAAAWHARTTIEGPRSHIARDTVRDVQHGAAPRKALLLNGFVLDAFDLDGNRACRSK
ncbi:hypothetical protein [Mycolicibacterium sphagni]|uniref:Uncharacterized protein n=1 Tax=Mycolicibacterium sphagni TaxID=1786 RepID=A0ABX2JZA2_9MYCO|nr:hypothetical protein [Mycolicibacterium sphagni]NTY62077.1 hypothetical protein [Mycolicibacterium sphagni]